ncbi:hypothetical protein NHX12_009155 [Muraenolepis orangiensis]|uniref:Uncharacterized protein n=1 Tax=Muraenolepis orangiensis TaxID=630683 RepID=A0A9Q0IAW7_9TELE|nr:hypothetical protein NHX12_009155 [Muraenolepis orangiensis]
MGTGFIYQFPAVSLQRITSEQSLVTGPPGASHSQYRTVSCQVPNGTEITVQRVFQGCRWPGPCPKLIRSASNPGPAGSWDRTAVPKSGRLTDVTASRCLSFLSLRPLLPWLSCMTPPL